MLGGSRQHTKMNLIDLQLVGVVICRFTALCNHVMMRLESIPVLVTIKSHYSNVNCPTWANSKCSVAQAGFI